MKNAKITPKHIFENGQDLTVATANTLIGQQIAVTWPVSKHNEHHIKVFRIGEVITQWELGARLAMEGYPNRQAYWKEVMDAKRIAEMKRNLELLDSEGNQTFCKFLADWNSPYQEATFTCSDADRYVKFIKVDLSKIEDVIEKHWNDEAFLASYSDRKPAMNRRIMDLFTFEEVEIPFENLDDLRQFAFTHKCNICAKWVEQ